jgi:hypothetical protein
MRCVGRLSVRRTGQPIKLRLSNFTWKQLAGEPIGLAELKEVDEALSISLTFAGSDNYDEVVHTMRAPLMLGQAPLLLFFWKAL